MISDARGGHVSPGVYTEERDVTYSTKSLGITSLGLVGETVKGPAFQPIDVEDWTEFVDYFKQVFFAGIFKIFNIGDHVISKQR